MYSFSSPTLKSGSQGKAITELHKRLAQLNCPVAPTEISQAVFGSGTEEAVKMFQILHKLPVTGTVDALTCSVIIAKTMDLQSSTALDYRWGPNPQRLQNALKDAGRQTNFPWLPSVSERAVTLAQRELGASETWGDNRGPSITRYRGGVDSDQEWCTSFLTYILNQSHRGLVKPTASTEALRGECLEKGAFHPLNQEAPYIPKKGDIIFFGSSREASNHSGIVAGFNAKTNEVIVIEGNASNAVRERSYPLTVRNDRGERWNQIVGFASIKTLEAVAKGYESPHLYTAGNAPHHGLPATRATDRNPHRA